jgi:Cyclin, N-terminal domain
MQTIVDTCNDHKIKKQKKMRSFLDIIEESVSRMQVMRFQEDSTYSIEDYFKLVPSASMNNIDVECRTKMAMWCYQVNDFCKYNRETTQISLSYLDRFLSTEAGLRARFDRSRYQLAFMTAIYVAAKVNEPEVIDPMMVSILSRGVYKVNEIEEMEREMLTAIKWRVNPPTSMSFFREFMNILPKEIHDILILRKVPELVQTQIERAVSKYNFMTVKASTLAFCSFLNALDHLVGDEYVMSTVGLFLSELLGIDCNSDEFVQVKLTLNENIIPEYWHHSKRNEVESKEKVCELGRTLSPRRICVCDL